MKLSLFLVCLLAGIAVILANKNEDAHDFFRQMGQGHNSNDKKSSDGNNSMATFQQMMMMQMMKKLFMDDDKKGVTHIHHHYGGGGQMGGGGHGQVGGHVQGSTGGDDDDDQGYGQRGGRGGPGGGRGGPGGGQGGQRGGRGGQGGGRSPQEMMERMMAMMRGEKHKKPTKEEHMKMQVHKKVMMCMHKMAGNITSFEKMKCMKIMSMLMKHKMHAHMASMKWKAGPKQCDDTVRSNDGKKSCLSPAVLNQKAVMREFKREQDSAQYPKDRIKEALKKGVFMTNDSNILQMYQRAMKVANGHEEKDMMKEIMKYIVKTEYDGPKSPYVHNMTRAQTCTKEMHVLGEVRHGNKWYTILKPYRVMYATCEKCNCAGVDAQKMEVKQHHRNAGQPTNAREKPKLDDQGREIMDDEDLYVGSYCDASHAMKHSALAYSDDTDEIHHVDLTLPMDCTCQTFKWRGCLQVPDVQKPMWSEMGGGHKEGHKAGHDDEEEP